MDDDAQVVSYYRLEMVAQMTGLTPARVRRLEQAGLVQPARVAGGARLYSDREVARLRRIRRLTQDLGINLAGVAVILRLTEELAELRLAERQRQGQRRAAQAK